MTGGNDRLDSFDTDDDRLLLEFEDAWLATNPPDWRAWCARLTDRPVDYSAKVCAELAAIDIERRWQRGIEHVIEWYLFALPALTTSNFVADLVVEEFKGRQRRGERPTHAPYQQRFPAFWNAIAGLLEQADRDRDDETSGQTLSSTIQRSPPRPRQNTPDPQAQLGYDDYLLQRLIGAGGSGKVYLARQRSGTRIVAVKFLKKAFLQRPEMVERFLAEASLAGKLTHPGIVSIHGLGRTPWGGYFLVLDWLAGGDLDAILKRGPVSLDDAIRWVREAALAIHFAHENGVVHCDLKPANLLLDACGHIVITDFGLARSTMDLAQQSSGLGGTPAFMAIEQVVASEGPIGPQTDVYGLGTVLYALLTGRPPYIGIRPGDILSQLVGNLPFPKPSELRAGILQTLDELTLQCLQRQPTRRPASAKIIAMRLAEIESENHFHARPA
jgi:hypothetical protein